MLAGLNDFLVSQQVPASYQRIILGAVLIIALAIDGLRTGATRPRWLRFDRGRKSKVMPMA